MKLTPEHITQLYKFTRAHYVEWYDLQTELVDHLANDIENIWEKEAGLSFNQAKNKAFKKFGIFGFHDVITAKSNALTRQYWKMTWLIFKEFFKIPKIILTLLISLILFTVFRFSGHRSTLIVTIFIILSVFPIIFAFYNNKKNKKRFKQTGKKWLFEQNIGTLGGYMFFAIQFPNIAFNLFRIQNVNTDFYALAFISLALALFGILNYILIWVIPPKLEEEMCKLFPEYKVSLKA